MEEHQTFYHLLQRSGNNAEEGAEGKRAGRRVKGYGIWYDMAVAILKAEWLIACVAPLQEVEPTDNPHGRGRHVRQWDCRGPGDSSGTASCKLFMFL